MKVLWFTNTSSCYTPVGCEGGNIYHGGGWISSAEKAVCQTGEVELAVSFELAGQPTKTVQHGVTYYPIVPPQQGATGKISKLLTVLRGTKDYSQEEASWTYYLEQFRKIVEDYQPDIIQVWGSERPFGLVWKVTGVPVLLHIQGLINPCQNSFLPPSVSWHDYLWSSKHPIKVLQNYQGRNFFAAGCHREQEIFRGITMAMGRTDWDERVSHILNPQLAYRHVDEILRDDFYVERERTMPKKLTIVTTISQPLYKGFDLVLKTAQLLKNALHIDFNWQCYGNIDPTVVERQTCIRHQDVRVRLMGVATSAQLQEAELKATLYFHSSYIDNSPNSLCEAQMLGVPVVSTNVGGIPSLVEHGVDGYLVPSNDPYQAACLIERLWQDSELNIAMGKRGQAKARERHNPQRVLQQIMSVYKEITTK